MCVSHFKNSLYWTRKQCRKHSSPQTFTIATPQIFTSQTALYSSKKTVLFSDWYKWPLCFPPDLPPPGVREALTPRLLRAIWLSSGRVRCNWRALRWCLIRGRVFSTFTARGRPCWHMCAGRIEPVGLLRMISLVRSLTKLTRKYRVLNLAQNQFHQPE